MGLFCGGAEEGVKAVGGGGTEDVNGVLVEAAFDSLLAGDNDKAAAEDDVG